MRVETRRKIILAFFFLLFVSVAAFFIEKEIYATSYSYVCWRVTQPFRPDRAVYDKVIEMTNPAKIPYLIKKYDDPDYWWIEGLFECWFYEPYMSMPVFYHKDDEKKYWATWWKKNKLRHSKLVMYTEPEFDIPSDD